MDARYVAAGSPGFAEEAQVARGPRSRLVRRAALAVVGLATLAFAAPAGAESITFSDPGEHSFPVPNGVSSLTVGAIGEPGGAASGGAGGPGAAVGATLPVTPGDTLYVEIDVGGAASDVSGDGGGASDLRTCSVADAGCVLTGAEDDPRLLVASGGGGASLLGVGQTTGQPAGGSGFAGANSITTTPWLAPCAAGAAGASDALGGGGGQCTTGGQGGGGNFPGQTGGIGQGGQGGADGLLGGGGGGFFGGGGGGGIDVGVASRTGGGGGGSSYVAPVATDVTFEESDASAASLTITYTVAPPIDTLIDSVEELDLQHGIENSLLKKLTNAQRNLDAGNTAGACDKLGAFIAQVSAQSGKKIDAADADDLIAEAQAVRASLGCA